MSATSTPTSAEVTDTAESNDEPADPGSSAVGSSSTVVSTTSPGFGLRFARFGRAFGDAFAHLFGDPKAELLAELTEQAPDDAVLDQDARDLMSNILKVGDQTVEDVVVSRADMIAVPTDASFEDVLDLAVEHGHSRFPVFDGTLDNITGIVTVKDILQAQKGNGTRTMEQVWRQPKFLAPSLPIIEALVELRECKEHMAFVVDEFGGIDGLLTMEDLIEPIVGDISDEHDADAPQIERDEGGNIFADAGVSLEDAEDELGKFLTDEEREEEFDTIGGLIFNIAGQIPGRGAAIEHPSGLNFVILEATPRRIRRVQISKKSES